MNKFSKFYFILLLATLISFTACSETISKESVEASLQYSESAIENDNAEKSTANENLQLPTYETTLFC